MQAARNELPAGRVLTITADAASSGSVRRLAESGSATQYAAAEIAASSTTVVGPFGTNRNYEILSATGVLTYAFSDGEPTTTSAGLAGSLSDETGTGAAVFANTPTLATPVIGAATGTSLLLSGAVTAASPVFSGTTKPDALEAICANVSTVGASRALTVPADSQAAIFGVLTVAGTLTVGGEVRVCDWPA